MSAGNTTAISRFLHRGGCNELQYAKRFTIKPALVRHINCLSLDGLQPKTINAYSRAIRGIGNSFDCRIDNFEADQLLDYFSEFLNSHSWSTVKLDLYELIFFYTRMLNKTWGDILLVKSLPVLATIPLFYIE